MNLIECFLSEPIRRGRSERTCELYRHILGRFIRDFPLAVPIDERLRSYASYLHNWENPRTRHQHHRVIKTFVRWMARKAMDVDWIGDYDPGCPDAPQEEPITPAQFRRIIDQAPATIRGRRNRAYYILLLYTGCRRNAIIGLRWGDVCWDSATIRIRTKGGVEQRLPLTSYAQETLKDWRRRCPSKEWIFPSMRKPGSHVSGKAAGRDMKRYAKAAGIGMRIHLHLLRHTCACWLDEAGVPVQVIQQVLGHSRVDTTMNYLRKASAQRRIRQALESVFSAI